MADGFIPPHSGYGDLITYKKSEIIYDATVSFCSRYVSIRSRTHDQMVQAARSGKQNIVEGSAAAATSKESEIKLTNVARASLEELLVDYKDFLRTKGVPQWAKDHPRAIRVRALSRGANVTYETYRRYIECTPPENAANTIICLIHQTNYLLDKQIRALEEAFLKEGGLRERMTTARLQRRKGQDEPPTDDA